MVRQLRTHSRAASAKQVRRALQCHELRQVYKRPYRTIMDPMHHLQVALNLVHRRFDVRSR
ncbi:hypothetical protein [Burkholderia sp. Nafp2/4-1b]|uniref:hypothetical protein n=1 Tax=Burkholderia sp. Nafp2/4-1b TaxID=2116686 RepID=UPI000EF955A5|nr:hypothetical protein [Burkholderia sp. Nafp2/4-1b]